MRVGTLVLAICLAIPVLAQQEPQAVPKPETILVEGVPAIPKAIADAIAPYASFQQVVFASWHPTERQMLVNTRQGSTFQAHLLSKPLGELKQATFEQSSIGTWNPGAANAWLAADGRSVLFRTDEGGNQRFQLYLTNPAGGPSTLLTDGKSRCGIPVWSNKRDRIAYNSTRRDTRDRDLWVMSPTDRTTDRMLAQVSGVWDAIDWSPDDRYLIAMQSISVAETRLWQIDTQTGERKPLTPEGKVAYGGGLYAADGKSAYITTDADGEFRRLARLDLATGAIVPLARSIDWDIDELALSSDRRTLAFTSNEAGVGTLYLFDTQSDRLTPVKGVPVGSVQGLSWRPKSSELSFNLTSPQLPWNVFTLDARTGAIERWTGADTGAVATASIPAAELIRWKSFDGLSISGFIYRPPSRFKGPRPVVVNIHGGPESQERPRFLGRSNYLLNELGTAIIYPNIRGSSGFGKSFLALDNGVRREHAIKDIGALLDWIAAQPGLDKGKVMLAGPSYGGLVSLSAAAMYPDRVRCVFDAFGISHIATFLGRVQPAIQPVRRAEYGDENDPAVKEFMDRTAPLTHVAKFKMPVFIVHGKNDASVPVQESEQMVEALKKNGTPVWAMYATNAGHGFADSRPNDEYSFYAWVLFIQKYLLT